MRSHVSVGERRYRCRGLVVRSVERVEGECVTTRRQARGIVSGLSEEVDLPEDLQDKGEIRLSMTKWSKRGR
jgi:hypothetical protein